MTLRHPHGRGRLVDDAEANMATYLSKDSIASGYSKLRDCRFESSYAENAVQIYGGVYRGSTIKGRTICAGNPLVVNSALDCSEVSGTPMIHNSSLLGITEICDRPLMNGIVAQDAIIYGQPSLLGIFNITGRVHEGTWTRAPKHIKLPWCDLSECIDGKVLLNCYCRKAEWWVRFGERIAQKWGWGEDQTWITIETIKREFLLR